MRVLQLHDFFPNPSRVETKVQNDRDTSKLFSIQFVVNDITEKNKDDCKVRNESHDNHSTQNGLLKNCWNICLVGQSLGDNDAGQNSHVEDSSRCYIQRKALPRFERSEKDGHKKIDNHGSEKPV